MVRSERNVCSANKPPLLCDSSSTLHSRLLQLQSRFTWDLKKEDIDLENLCTRLQDHIELDLGQPGAVALSYSLLAYVRYSKSWRD